ncbi:MAG: rhomboid family intramembrane serine protease [Dysgonomonas sp.]|nr:rhomboid family intramembrane serine protease [Dysgonomonas sp.]
MKENLTRLKTSITYAFLIILIPWIVKIIEFLFSTSFHTWGIYPRSFFGLWGVLTSPIVHGSFDHLIGNTVPFLVLATLLFFFYKKKSVYIFVVLWLTSGVLTWIISRSSWHIGMSSVIYAMASFLIFGGFFSKKVILIIISLVVIFAYSGLIYGIFPTTGHISWEGHLSGAISGFFWAYTMRKELARSR